MAKVIGNKGKKKVKIKVAGAGIRILALVCDFLLSYILYFFLLGIDSTRVIITDLHQALNSSNIFAELFFSNLFIELTIVLMIFWNIRVFTALFLGVSLNQYLLLLRSGSKGFFRKRIEGMTRELFGVFTFPFFIIADLPLVLCRRSFKEMLSGSKICDKKSPIQVMILFVLIPIYLILFSISPFWENSELLTGAIVKTDLTSEKALNNQSDFSKFNLYSSNLFHFTALSDLSDENLKLIPTFQVEQSAGQKKYSPRLLVYNKKNGQNLILEKVKDVNVFELIELSRLGNPLFKSVYPNLDRVLQARDMFKGRKDFQNTKIKGTLFNQKVSDEFLKLVQASLNLGLDNLVEQIFIQGPFIRGNILLRNKLLALISESGKKEIAIERIGNHLFLTSKYVSSNALNEPVARERLLPLETPFPILLQMEEVQDKDLKDTREEFKKEFLERAEWWFDYDKILGPKDKEITALYVLDYFFLSEHSQTEFDQFKNALYQYYFENAKEALLSGDAKLQAHFLSSLNRIILVVDAFLINGQNKTDDLIKFLTSIKSALQNSDKEFFSGM